MKYKILLLGSGAIHRSFFIFVADTLGQSLVLRGVTFE